MTEPWDLDPEFTRTQLFLIAELLGKINKPNEYSVKWKAIRDANSFLMIPRNTSRKRRISWKGVEAENAKYQKSFAEAEKHLKTSRIRKD